MKAPLLSLGILSFGIGIGLFISNFPQSSHGTNGISDEELQRKLQGVNDAFMADVEHTLGRARKRAASWDPLHLLIEREPDNETTYRRAVEFGKSTFWTKNYPSLSYESSLSLARARLQMSIALCISNGDEGPCLKEAEDEALDSFLESILRLSRLQQSAERVKRKYPKDWERRLVEAAEDLQ